MKILWVINMALPLIASECGIKQGVGGGWLTGIAEELLSKESIDLVVCFRDNSNIHEGRIGRNLKYYSFKAEGFYQYSKKVESRFKEIISKEKPDIIHIFGTEFPHTLAAMNVADSFHLLKKTIISIQGLVSIYAQHYFANLPHHVIHKYSIRDFIKRDNIYLQSKKYAKRGTFEILALKKAYNVIGRTNWDEACVKAINPSVNYFFCNETLRKEFYSCTWEADRCEKHSIFLGSSAYPIKGFHCVLEIMPQILKKYPDAIVYVTGNNLLQSNGFRGLIHRTFYQIYLRKLIKTKHLEKNIVFLGELSAQEMKERMLKSNVFILPSSIENSPNTLGEAMILGVPCIASDVGGVSNLAENKKDLLAYPFDESYMLPYYIDKIFIDKKFARELSQSAKKHASFTHDKKINNDRLLAIYKTVLQNELEQSK